MSYIYVLYVCAVLNNTSYYALKIIGKHDDEIEHIANQTTKMR